MFLMFSPIPGGMIHFGRAYFSDGLKFKPPPRLQQHVNGHVQAYHDQIADLTTKGLLKARFFYMTLAWHWHVATVFEDLMRAQTPPKGHWFGMGRCGRFFVALKESIRRFRCAWSIWHHELASNKTALTGWQVLLGVMLASWTVFPLGKSYEPWNKECESGQAFEMDH